MAVSLILTEQIIKLFIILLLGFLLVKLGLLKASDSKSVSVILVYLILPCMIINAFQIDYTPQVRTGLIFTIAASVIVHLIFIAVTALLKRLLGLDTIEQMTVIYTNGGILVIPLVQAMLGDDYVIYSCSFIVVQIILLWTHCKQKLCSGQKLELKSIFLNANMVAIYVGIILFFTQIHLPDVIGGTIDMLANMVGPMGMLLAGMAISEVPLKHVFMTGRNYLVVLLRLFVDPGILLAGFKLSGAASTPVNTGTALSGAAGMILDGKNILMIVYLACITPACATVTSMAQLYDSNAAESSMFYVLTTICSIISMPVMIFVYTMVI